MVLKGLATVPNSRKGRTFMPFKRDLRQLLTVAILFVIFLSFFFLKLKGPELLFFSSRFSLKTISNKRY